MAAGLLWNQDIGMRANYRSSDISSRRGTTYCVRKMLLTLSMRVVDRRRRVYVPDHFFWQLEAVMAAKKAAKKAAPKKAAKKK
jgi:hypothetical protein